jgi:hypothetical protein
MVFGMLPIAMSTEAGSEWKTGLAWAIIGGLISSLLLTLVLVPVVYTKVDEWKEKIPAFVRRLAARWRRPESGEPEPALEQSRLLNEVGRSHMAVHASGNGNK